MDLIIYTSRLRRKSRSVLTIRVSQDAGIRALLVHALSESAKHFYKRFGFVESPIAPMTLMLGISDAYLLPHALKNAISIDQ